MSDFKIIINEEQAKRLDAAGFDIMKDTDEILFYTYNMIQWLNTHNKNFTKDQEHRIGALNDLWDALYKGF